MLNWLNPNFLRSKDYEKLFNLINLRDPDITVIAYINDYPFSEKESRLTNALVYFKDNCFVIKSNARIVNNISVSAFNNTEELKNYFIEVCIDLKLKFIVRKES